MPCALTAERRNIMKVKFVKKLVALSLVSAMTLTGLAGCGSKDSGDGKKEGGDGKTLKVAAFNGGNGDLERYSGCV